MSIVLKSPFLLDKMRERRAGDEVLISGDILTARDVAHKRLCRLMEEGGSLPLDLREQVIYFTGPSPARPGQVSGSAGPTTSYRMDGFSPMLIRSGGISGMIGKGSRSREVVEAMKETGCVYFAAIGGAGALIAESIQASEIVCYEDLGPEAMRRLKVKDFPLIVAIDSLGGNLYERGPARYRRQP